MKTFVFWLCLAHGFFAFVSAHDVYESTAQVLPRTWHLTQENKTIHGRFSFFKDGKVFIEDEKGFIRSYVLQDFSSTDQAWVQLKAASIERLNNHPQLLSTSKLFASPVNETPLLSYMLGLFSLGLLIYTLRKPQLRFINALAWSLVGTMLGLGLTFYPARRQSNPPDPAFLSQAFAPFKHKLSTSQDSKYFYVHSLGIPDHEMMTGITAWQQQVPLPQCYIGTNAWSLPLNPIMAANPIPVNQQHFLRGAVALAVNGIAIFNPYTTSGVDAYLDGQLDKWGGHSGRADDYHYHLAPMFLYDQLPASAPIAIGLDGFAVYGSKEPDGSAMKALDENNGHFGTDGVYHYHGITKAPYMIGRMAGNVTEDPTLQQIVPQPEAKGVRPALTPLKGATITKHEPNALKNGYVLSYTLNNQSYAVDYKWTTNGVFTYNFIAPTGTTTQTYNGAKPCSIPTASEAETPPAAFQLTLFPNPSHGLLNLQLASDLTAQTVQSLTITNLLGQTVYQSPRFQTQISVASWPKGVYFVRLQLPKQALIQKFILQ